jgi:hypothetical protein
MSNIRDLYKNKGKKLSDDEINSKNQTKEKLSSGIDFLTNKNVISPLLSDRILKLQHSSKISQNSTEKRDLDYKISKENLPFILLSFGLNFQRLQGKGFSSVSDFFKEFSSSYSDTPGISEKQCNDILDQLNKQGLLYSFTPVILFEALDQSQDINKIFQLLQPGSNSLRFSELKISLNNWSESKLKAVIDILVVNGLVILDQDVLWFPQLED